MKIAYLVMGYVHRAGDELRRARRNAGLTQEQLAAKADISREYVSQLERDRQSPTVDTLLRVCRILGVSPSQIIESIEKETQSGRIRSR
jgi:transcriptional regulator with XRE-family HTH domain